MTDADSIVNRSAKTEVKRVGVWGDEEKAQVGWRKGGGAVKDRGVAGEREEEEENERNGEKYTKGKIYAKKKNEWVLKKKRLRREREEKYGEKWTI